MQKLTVEISAADLPTVIARQLPGGRAIPGGRYRVTVEDMDDAAKLSALRAEQQLAAIFPGQTSGIVGETDD